MRIICIIPKQKASLEESYGCYAFCYSPANDQKTIILLSLQKSYCSKKSEWLKMNGLQSATIYAIAT